MPSCFEYVGTSSRDWILFTCTNDDRFCADGRKPVDVGADVNFHDVIFGQRKGSKGV